MKRVSRRHDGMTAHRALVHAVLYALPALSIAVLGSSCTLDPVHSNAVESLGDEREELYPPKSQYHRPGEPCAVCHSNKGPADDAPFILAGTVFWGPTDYLQRVDQAYVRIFDATRKTKCFVTNCNGNFYVRPEQIRDLKYPLLVSVERVVNPSDPTSPTFRLRRMGGHIGREASCATCHIQGLLDFGSPGPIRLFDDQAQVDAATKQAGIQVPAVCPEDKPVATICPEDRF